MGGVDKSDQCLSYYPVSRNKQRKYYKKKFRHLINQSVWNASVIYKKKSGGMRHLNFRMKLIESLIEEGSIHTPQIRNYPPKSSESVARFPSYVEQSCAKKTKARVCVVCSQKKMQMGSGFDAKQGFMATTVTSDYVQHHASKHTIHVSIFKVFSIDLTHGLIIH